MPKARVRSSISRRSRGAPARQQRAAVNELFGWSAVRYVQKLNAVLDSDEAPAGDRQS
ncbi:DUF3263 domain-containing protein [Williamsia muralis]|uniref:DUF3263 domain-containing protein n=1 Tax=Williamsia marianensis TaxID=85044 RepID=UPI000E32C9E6